MHIQRIVMSSGVAVALALAACGSEPQQSTAVETEISTPQGESVQPGIIDHTVTSLGGDTVDLASFRGRPMLIVNTASECGYTPQYASLQSLHEKYGERGLVVIGFPSNDFGQQEPGTAEEIASFCRLNYGVTFPMMAKVHTKGPDQAEIYRTLTTETAGEIQGEIRWNFTKFLVDGGGQVVARYEPAVEPMDDQVTSAIEALLSDSG